MVDGLCDVRLQTERLILREHEEADWQAVLAYAGDPDVLRYRSSDPADKETVQRNLARIRAQREETPRARFEFAVVRRDTDELIGWLPLLLTHPELEEAEVGWTLARAHWGQGFATEAARAALCFAFEELHLHRVWARCVEENTASRRIMEKIGMRHEGTFVQSHRIKGQWADIAWYAVLEGEYAQQKRQALRRPLDNFKKVDTQ